MSKIDEKVRTCSDTEKDIRLEKLFLVSVILASKKDRDLVC